MVDAISALPGNIFVTRMHLLTFTSLAHWDELITRYSSFYPKRAVNLDSVIVLQEQRHELDAANLTGTSESVLVD